MGQAAGVGDKDALDCVITNALVVDYTGHLQRPTSASRTVYFRDRQGRQSRCHAGVRPHVIGVTPRSSPVGLILTAAGSIRTSNICPQQAYEAIAPASRRWSAAAPARPPHLPTTCSPGSHYLKMMLRAVATCRSTSALPARENTSKPEGLAEQISRRARPQAARGLGHHPAAIDCCLRSPPVRCEVTIHTDTLNESGFVEPASPASRGARSTLPQRRRAAATPRHLRVCGQPNRASPARPTPRPYTINTLDEHLDNADGLPPPRQEPPRTSPSPRAASRRDDAAKTSSMTSAPSA